MKTLKAVCLIIIMGCMVGYTMGQTVITQPKIKKIVVTGSSEMEVDPDEIYVNFVLREYQNSRKEKIGIDAIKKEFLLACEKAGVQKENIRVEGVSGNSFDNWYLRKRKKDPDFIATITYVIKFESTKMIDNLVPNLSDEAVQNMYISKMSNSKMEALRKDVKIKATQAAKEKATYLAQSIGEVIAGALLIEEIESGPVYPIMMMKQSNVAMDSAEGAYGGETSMPFEKIKIRYETRAEFELK